MYILHLALKIDIAAVTETYFKAKHSDSTVVVSDYILYYTETRLDARVVYACAYAICLIKLLTYLHTCPAFTAIRGYRPH